jgi:ketosteroid isomerase-like protein
MCRLRRVPLALVALLFVASSAVGLLAIGRGGAVSRASQVDVAALTTEIQKQDVAFFGAFNAHELEAMMAFFAADVEFYHDKDGRLSFDQVKAGFQTMFSRNDGIRRDLVPGTLRVYPVPNYGAIETGSHKFCHVERGKDDCGAFQFVLVWQKQEGRWRVTRALSFDH